VSKHRPPRPHGTADRPDRSGGPGQPLSGRTVPRLAIALLVLLPLVFYLKYLFGDRLLFGTDWLGAGGYSMRLFMSEYIKSHGNVAFWMPALLSGQPTVAAFFGDLFYPTQLFRLFVPVHVVWAWTFYLHVVAAGIGTYLFLRELKADALPAALGGVAYMFAGSLLTLTYAGHDGRLIGSALLPLALFFLHRAMTRRQLFHFLLMGLVLALQLLSGHVQKVYYTGLILVAYFLFMLIASLRRERSAGAAARLCLYFVTGIGFGVALAAIQYLPIYGNMPFAARGSERGYEYATSWSMPVREVLDLLSPRFSGILGEYRGSNPFKLHSEYLGLLPLLFAVIGIIRGWRRGITRFFLLAFIVSLLMAWGGNTPFYRLPYLLLPGISKFRGPAMIFFLAAFSIAVLAGLGFQSALDWLRQRRGAGPGSALLIATLLAGVMTLDIGLSLRLWNEERGYIRGVPPPAEYFAPDEAVGFLRTDTSLYRVLPLNYENSDAGLLMQYGIQSVGGQMPNPLQNYQDFIGAGSSVMFQAGNLLHPGLLNLLNVKYIIGPRLPDDDSRYDERSRQLIRQLRALFSRPALTPVSVGRQYVVYRNADCLPRAYIAREYLVAADRDEVLGRLMSPGFDPGQTVLLAEDPGIPPGTGSPAGQADVTKFDANRVEVSARLDRPGLLVLGENYHPDWRVEVDGRPARLLRAFHTLRAVALPPGEHQVVFKFESAWYRAGSLISLAALLFLAVVAVAHVARRPKKQRPAKPAGNRS
jgi:hypothetical protein